MPRPRRSIPSYLPRTQSGKARAVWPDPTGTPRVRMLPGPFDGTESRAAFAARLLELEAAPHRVPAPEPGGLTIAELLLAHLDHAERHYRTPDGKPTGEIREVRVVTRALRELYADKPVAEFGPVCVKAARQRWVNDGRSRTECNRRVAMIKRIFRRAVSEELTPAAVYQAVTTVAGLRKGRTAAREKPPAGPVDDAVVDATLPFLGRHVRGLVEFQRLAGCRAGEACAVRRCDIDTGGANWLYRPPHHKTARRGKSRTITIGPRARAVLRGFLTPTSPATCSARAGPSRSGWRSGRRGGRRRATRRTWPATRRSGCRPRSGRCGGSTTGAPTGWPSTGPVTWRSRSRCNWRGRRRGPRGVVGPADSGSA